MVSSKKNKEKRIDGYAKLSFWLSIGSIVPLLGFFTNMISIVYGIMAIIRINKKPDEYRGLALAIAGLSIDALFVMLWVWALIYHPEMIVGV